MKRTSIGVGLTTVLAVLALSGTAFGGACKTGMTWVWQQKAVNSASPAVAETGVISVGCNSWSGKGSCDATNGDTACKKALPILCTYRDPSGSALTNFPLPTGVDNSNPFYYGWAGEVVATSKPVRPCTDLAGYGNGNGTLSAAKAFCQAEFGPNWDVAEFHDSAVSGGGGWDFHAYGGVMNPQSTHFWVDINDQPNGTCWNRN